MHLRVSKAQGGGLGSWLPSPSSYLKEFSVFKAFSYRYTRVAFVLRLQLSLVLCGKSCLGHPCERSVVGSRRGLRAIFHHVWSSDYLNKKHQGLLKHSDSGYFLYPS